MAPVRCDHCGQPQQGRVGSTQQQCGLAARDTPQPAASRARWPVASRAAPDSKECLLQDVLDIRRRQVFVEAVIMEVNLENTLDLGVSAHGGTIINDVSFRGSGGPSRN